MEMNKEYASKGVAGAGLGTGINGGCKCGNPGNCPGCPKPNK